MDWQTWIGALIGALFGGGGVWIVNMYTAPEKKKKEQISNLVTIIESQDTTIKNLIARQDAYEERVNMRIAESVKRWLQTKRRLTRLENAVHLARLCKYNTEDEPCPAIEYIDDENTKKQHCKNCQNKIKD